MFGTLTSVLEERVASSVDVVKLSLACDYPLKSNGFSQMPTEKSDQLSTGKTGRLSQKPDRLSQNVGTLQRW